MIADSEADIAMLPSLRKAYFDDSIWRGWFSPQ